MPPHTPTAPAPLLHPASLSAQPGIWGGNIHGNQAWDVTALARASSFLEELTDSGHLVLVVDDEPQRAVSRGTYDLLKTEFASIGGGRDDISENNSRGKEGDVVDLKQPFSNGEGPDALVVRRGDSSSSFSSLKTIFTMSSVFIGPMMLISLVGPCRPF